MEKKQINNNIQYHAALAAKKLHLETTNNLKNSPKTAKLRGHFITQGPDAYAVPISLPLHPSADVVKMIMGSEVRSAAACKGEVLENANVLSAVRKEDFADVSVSVEA